MRVTVASAQLSAGTEKGKYGQPFRHESLVRVKVRDKVLVMLSAYGGQCKVLMRIAVSLLVARVEQQTTADG